VEIELQREKRWPTSWDEIIIKYTWLEIKEQLLNKNPIF